MSKPVTGLPLVGTLVAAVDASVEADSPDEAVRIFSSSLTCR